MPDVGQTVPSAWQAKRPALPGFSEHQAKPKLRLARIAESALHRAIEIKQQARGFRMLRIRAVGQVENVHDGLQTEALTQLNILRSPKVQREKRIVLPQGIAPDDITARQ